MPKKGENIYKRKDGRWEGRYKSGYNSNGKALYHSIYRKTYSDVKEKLVKIKSERIKGFSLCTLTIKELGLLWISNVEKKVKQSTLSVYITKLNKYIIPILGGVKFDALSVDIINDFINTLISKKFLPGILRI